MPSLISKREQKRLRASRNRERGLTGMKYVSYCPMCPRMVHPGDPEKDQKAVVDGKAKTARCPKGHEWLIS